MRLMKPTMWTLASCVLGSPLAPVAQAQNEQVARMETAVLSPAGPSRTRRATPLASRSRPCSSSASRPAIPSST